MSPNGPYKYQTTNLIGLTKKFEAVSFVGHKLLKIITLDKFEYVLNNKKRLQMKETMLMTLEN